MTKIYVIVISKEIEQKYIMAARCNVIRQPILLHTGVARAGHSPDELTIMGSLSFLPG